MRTIFKFTAVAISLLWASLVYAGDRFIIVELFTSQGCSSCPPADVYLHDLAKQDDILAFSYHVDYWDHIGWKDTFASPAFTRHQRAYAKAQGERIVYTPQLIVNGMEHVAGNRRGEVKSTILKHRELPVTADLQARFVANGIEVYMQNGTKGDFEAILISYLPKSTVKITRGENRGLTMDYTNVVTSHKVIGHWNGHGSVKLNAPKMADMQHAVLLQHKGHGAIVAAALVR